MQQLGKHSNRLKQLRGRVRHRSDGEVVVDGRRLVSDLVRWDVPIRELYLVPELAASTEAAPWIAVAGHSFEVAPEVLDAVSPTRNPQGVLAIASQPTWPPWPARKGVALWLDTVQDPGNLGAIVRAAAGLGASAVLLSPGCCDPFSPAAVRGSAGAVFRLPVEREVPASRAADRIRAASGQVWATGTGGTPLAAWTPTWPLLLLLGAEGRGLDPAIGGLADGEVTVPLDRGIESLNVAVAAAVVLAHLRA
jgi:TrmH family RNA methyltransferase